MQKPNKESKTIKINGRFFEKKKTFYKNIADELHIVKSVHGGFTAMLHIVKKPDIRLVSTFLKSKAKYFKAVFLSTPELKRRYAHVSETAAYDIYAKALEAQIYIYKLLLKKKYAPKLVEYENGEQDWRFLFALSPCGNIKSFFQNPSNHSDKTLKTVFSNIIETLCDLYTSCEFGELLYPISSPDDILIYPDGGICLTNLFSCRFEKIYLETNDPDINWQSVLERKIPSDPYIPIEGFKDIKSEFYGIGALFYETTTNSSLQAASERVKSDKYIPPNDLDVSCPYSINYLISFCLEITPGRRFQSFQDIMSAVNSEYFGEIACIGKNDKEEQNEFHLGQIKRNDDRIIPISLIKKLNIETVPFLLENLSIQWSMSPSPETPNVSFQPENASNRQIDGNIIFEFPKILPPGRYEGVIKIKTTYGIKYLKTSAEVYSASIFTLPFMGAVYAAAFALIMLALRVPEPYTKTDRAIWNKYLWTYVSRETLVDSSITFSSFNGSDWIVHPKNQIKVSTMKNKIEIEGKNIKKFEKSGITSSFYIPASASLSLAFSITKTASDKSSKAEAKFFSSNSAYISCIINEKGDILFLAYTPNKSYEPAKACIENGKANVKMIYSASDYTLKCFVSDKEIAVFKEFELDDFAPYFSGAALENKAFFKWIFDNISFKMGAALKKIPPYMMVASGKYSVYDSPNAETKKRIYTIVKGEKAEVIEERGKYVRIKLPNVKNQLLEGWIEKKLLRFPEPKETIPITK